MTNELEPLKECPFCGGEAKLNEAWCVEKGWYVADVMCSHCAAQVCSQGLETSSTEEADASAINAWNTRYKRTCKNVGVEPFDFECSECLFATSTDPSGLLDWQTDRWKFCPNCGAEVVDGN